MTVTELVAEIEEVEVVADRDPVMCLFGGKYARRFDEVETEAFEKWVEKNRNRAAEGKPIEIHYGLQNGLAIRPGMALQWLPPEGELPPDKIASYLMDYSRKARTMRFWLGDKAWLVKAGANDGLAGQCYVEGADPETGQIRVIGKLKLHPDGTFSFTPPKGLTGEDMPDGTRDIDYRVCYNRPNVTFRSRTADAQVSFSEKIVGMRGYMNLVYYAGQSHVFHRGPSYVDGQEVLHFA